MREQALAVCGKVRPVAMANYSATSLTTLLHMVAHGHGVTLIPEMAASADRAVPDLRIVPFTEPAPSRRICMAWRGNSSRQDECRMLAQLVRETRPPSGGARNAAALTQA
jgi:LysR family hydrogen peroxide-inducible transcriptional activator